MSKIIASAAIRGAHNIVDKAEKKWKEAMDKWGAKEPVGFPNTAYYLPIIYGISGMKVEKLGDMEAVLKKGKALLPPLVKTEHHLPYLGPTLDAGMITFWAPSSPLRLLKISPRNFKRRTFTYSWPASITAKNSPSSWSKPVSR